jgi:hypothetical protein
LSVCVSPEGAREIVVEIAALKRCSSLGELKFCGGVDF